MANRIKSPPLEGKSPYELRLDQSSGTSESFIRTALATGDVGFLHSFTTGSTVDGPGVRLVDWTAGCQRRCLYCPNPDTWNMINGMAVPLERAVAELRKYRRGLQVMRGGFTLSGGEPLMQDRFAVKLFAASRVMGIHNVIETNGFLGDRLTDEEIRLIDLVLLDIKSWGSERHRRLTGKEIEPTLAFARRIAAMKRPLWVRLVLVPGLTDDPEIVSGIAAFAAGLGVVERVEVLPFHQMGRYKWEKLGLDYQLSDVQPPSSELVEETCRIFRREGLKAY
ncbi:MAG: pyruvate formate lyase-activating protein [Planctomycetota bacterium]|nr:MAG: pyruvate formate lyase-activating protein [Planctomycetota bacterium]